MAKPTMSNQYARVNNTSIMNKTINAFKNALIGARNSRLDFNKIADTLKAGKRLNLDKQINHKATLAQAKQTYGNKLVDAQDAYVKLLDSIKQVRKPDGTPLSRGQFRKITSIANEQFSKILSGEKMIDIQKMQTMLDRLMIMTESATAATSGTVLGLEAIEADAEVRKEQARQANRKDKNTNSSSSNSGDLDNPGNSSVPFSIE